MDKRHFNCMNEKCGKQLDDNDDTNGVRFKIMGTSDPSKTFTAEISIPVVLCKKCFGSVDSFIPMWLKNLEVVDNERC